jgi:hypothetical protein
MSEVVSRWWEMAAVSLLSTTEGLAVVKDVLKYLPLRKDIARDCLTAGPFETLINLQRGLGAERSKIPNDMHELSPRGSHSTKTSSTDSRKSRSPTGCGKHWDVVLVLSKSSTLGPEISMKGGIRSKSLSISRIPSPTGSFIIQLQFLVEC